MKSSRRWESSGRLLTNLMTGGEAKSRVQYCTTQVLITCLGVSPSPLPCPSVKAPQHYQFYARDVWATLQWERIIISVQGGLEHGPQEII